MFKDLPDNTRTILEVFGPFVAVIVLFILVGNFGFSKISEENIQISKAKRDQTVLTQKLNLLRTVTGTSQNNATIATAALPSENPTLILISQLKNLSLQTGAAVSSVKAGPEVIDSSGLSRVDITFDIAGPRDPVITFITSLENIAPITLIDKLKLNEAAGAVRASVSVKSFWSGFPKTIPAVTDPISDLSSAEKNTLSVVANLTQPNFVVVPPSQTSGKSNPFSQ